MAELQTSEPSSVVLPGHKQGARMEAEQPGHEPISIWDAGASAAPIPATSPHWSQVADIFEGHSRKRENNRRNNSQTSVRNKGLIAHLPGTELQEPRDPRNIHPGGNLQAGYACHCRRSAIHGLRQQPQVESLLPAAVRGWSSLSVERLKCKRENRGPRKSQDGSMSKGAYKTCPEA